MRGPAISSLSLVFSSLRVALACSNFLLINLPFIPATSATNRLRPDFYQVNGTAYPLDVVQKYLELCTGYPMPSAVDSAAIAGLVDLLHTRGVFALSVRYAVCLGLKTANMNEALARIAQEAGAAAGSSSNYGEGEGDNMNDDDAEDEDGTSAFPTVRDFCRVAAFFERALDSLLERTGHGLDYICSMPEERE